MAKNQPSKSDGSKQRKKRTSRTFPASSFMEAIPLANALQKFASGQRARRITLFDQMERSADSGASKQLVTNSSQYGITIGGYTAEYLELTPTGALASGPDANDSAKLAARLQLAIEQIEPFQILYEAFRGKRLPAKSILRDHTIEHGTTEDHADECVETFLANARDLGLVDTVAGAERMLNFEMVLEAAGKEAPTISDDVDDSGASEEDASDNDPPVWAPRCPHWRVIVRSIFLGST